MKRTSGLPNQCGAFRQARGFSVAELAAAVGVTRQTIYSIEAGSYVPNAVVALHLARALGVTVEELFPLPEAAPASSPATEQALLLPDAGPLHPGQSVQLGRVGKRLIAFPPAADSAYLPLADAVVARHSPSRRRAEVTSFENGPALANRLVLAGCDPGMSVLRRHAQAAGIDLLLVHRNSSRSLQLLRDRSVHIAGTHLRDPASHESNLPAIRQLFPARSVAVVSFAWWEVGLLAAPANPHSIRGVEDLARPGITFRNREPGSGARALFDGELPSHGIHPEQIQGYHDECSGHLAAARAVAEGHADAAVATRAAAQRFGLHFIPLLRERYDFVFPRRLLDSPGIQTLLDLVTRARFRRELALLGYETTSTGDRLL